MLEEGQNFLSQEPIKFLQFFPIRHIQILEFNIQKFQTFYDNLCCTICRQIFTLPTYLKCSHRFCKDCIQKYIRLKENRTCPMCRADISTKRDLRHDYLLNSIIDFAFGGSKKFKQKIEKVETEFLKNMVSSNKFNGKRERQNFDEKQIKANELPPSKKKRLDIIDKIQKMYNLSSEKQIQSSQKQGPIELGYAQKLIISSQNTQFPPKYFKQDRLIKKQPQIDGQIFKNTEPLKDSMVKKENNIEKQNITKKGKKSKNIEQIDNLGQPKWKKSAYRGKKRYKPSIIEIKSSGQQIQINSSFSPIQQQKASSDGDKEKDEEFLQLWGKKNDVQLEQFIQKSQKSVENLQKDQTKTRINKEIKMEMSSQCSQKNKLQKQIKELTNEKCNKYENSQKNQNVKISLCPQLQVVKEHLKKQYGDNYLKYLIQNTEIKCNIMVKIRPFSLCTPRILENRLIIGMNLKISQISSMIAKKLNIQQWQPIIKMWKIPENKQCRNKKQQKQLLKPSLKIYELLQQQFNDYYDCINGYKLEKLFKKGVCYQNMYICFKSVLYYEVDIRMMKKM